MLLGHPAFSVQPTGLFIKENSYFIHFENRKVLLKENGDCLTIPVWADIQPLLESNFQPFELAQAGEHLIFCTYPHQPVHVPETASLHYHPIDIFRGMPLDTAGLLTSALHLWQWYQTNRYCGCCGKPMQPDHHERALRCADCGHLLFPAIAPAVIVAITCKNRILLAHNLRHQQYALVAGYVEVGETLEHALRREVKEEVGLDIYDIRYLGDQPWGISGSQMFAFHAKADDQQPICIQQSELKDARWFDRDEVEPLQHKVSIAYELMERFRNGTL